MQRPVLRAAPAILISVAINIGCSLFAAWCFGVAWQGPAIVTFVGVIASTVSSRSRSTNAAVRAVAPIAILESPGGIYAIRIFWRELYFDRGTMSDLCVGLIGLSTYTAIALFFASGAAFAARIVTIVAGEGVALSVLLLVSAILVVFEARVPNRTSTTAHLYDLEHLQMFESLLAAVKTARLPSGKLNEALALWMTSDADLPQAVLPEPRSIWKLESLLALIRITRAVGEEERLSAWRGPIVDALQRIITNGAVTPIGLRPSLGYTILAAQIIDEAGLASSIPIDPMLDSIAGQLEQWLSGRIGASAGPVASACRLLAAHGRPWPGADRMRMQSLMAIEFLLSRPIMRTAVGEIAAYTELLEDTNVRDHLASIVRSRLREALQLNSGNDVPLLLDCYLTAVSLGETDLPRLATAESAIEQIAERMATELTKIRSEAIA